MTPANGVLFKSNSSFIAADGGLDLFSSDVWSTRKETEYVMHAILDLGEAIAAFGTRDLGSSTGRDNGCRVILSADYASMLERFVSRWVERVVGRGGGGAQQRKMF